MHWIAECGSRDNYEMSLSLNEPVMGKRLKFSIYSEPMIIFLKSVINLVITYDFDAKTDNKVCTVRKWKIIVAALKVERVCCFSW